MRSHRLATESPAVLAVSASASSRYDQEIRRPCGKPMARTDVLGFSWRLVCRHLRKHMGSAHAQLSTYWALAKLLAPFFSSLPLSTCCIYNPPARVCFHRRRARGHEGIHVGGTHRREVQRAGGAGGHRLHRCSREKVVTQASSLSSPSPRFKFLESICD